MQYLILLAIIVGLVVLYVYLILLFFTTLAPGLAALGAVATSLVVGWNYLRTFVAGLRGTLATKADAGPIPPEPAYKNYFFHRAFVDIRDIWQEAWRINERTLVPHFRGAVSFCFKPEWQTWFIWPLGVVVFVIGLSAVVGAAVGFSIVAAVHVVLVATVCAVVYLAALYFRLIDWLGMLWRRATFECPHPGCYARFGLPHYRCSNPECEQLHRQLIPGSYGVFRRRCACGALVVTSGLFKRHRLRAFCPQCKGELTAIIGSIKSLHIPIVGGRSTGKSTTMVRLVDELHTLFGNGGRRFHFPVEEDAQRFVHERAEVVESRELHPTIALSPRAFLTLLTEADRSQTLLYLYDAAGELYQAAEDERRRQYYLKHAAGFLLLIDPFAIEEVRRKHASLLADDELRLRVSTEQPQDVYDRFITALRHAKQQQRRLSVVVTKRDLLDPHEPQLLEGTDQSARSTAVRGWLIAQGEHNLVQSIEHDFSEVAYFAVALKGDDYRPEDILAPTRWLLGRGGVIAPRPRRGLSVRSHLVASVGSVAVASALFLALFGGGIALAAVGGRNLAQGFALAVSTVAEPTLVAQSTVAPEARPAAIVGTATPAATVPPAAPTAFSGPARVVNRDLNLRVRPDPSAPIATVLPRGSQVSVLAQSNVVGSSRWVRVRVGSREGWVNQRFLAPASNSAQRRQVFGVSPERLRVRSAPDQASAIVARLIEGAEVELLGARNLNGRRWARIRVDSLEGWVAAEFLRPVE